MRRPAPRPGLPAVRGWSAVLVGAVLLGGCATGAPRLQVPLPGVSVLPDGPASTAPSAPPEPRWQVPPSFDGWSTESVTDDVIRLRSPEPCLASIESLPYTGAATSDLDATAEYLEKRMRDGLVSADDREVVDVRAQPEPVEMLYGQKQLPESRELRMVARVQTAQHRTLVFAVACDSTDTSEARFLEMLSTLGVEGELDPAF